MSVYPTRYGPIYYDTSGNDHRPNIRNSNPVFPKRHEAVKFQEPALKSWREAEKILGRRLGKGPWSRRKARAIAVTGTWRSFELQSNLYHSDSTRYASPYTSGHVQAIAADVDTNFPHFDLAIDILLSLNWHRARPDEPWHLSYGPTV